MSQCQFDIFWSAFFVKHRIVQVHHFQTYQMLLINWKFISIWKYLLFYSDWLGDITRVRFLTFIIAYELF